MRSPQKSNRARGRGGRRPNGNILNRVFESSGPDGKVRGTPQQIVDKYLALARDAQTSGDRVKAENFLQHAEHYQRMIIEAMEQREQRREQQAVDVEQVQRVAADPPPVSDPEGKLGAASGARPDGNGEASGDVAGLTTIDPSEEAGESLLIEPAEVAQPARRRRSRGNGQTATPAGGNEG